MSLELHGSRYGSHLMCLIMNAPSPKDIGKETWKHSGSSDLKSKTKKISSSQYKFDGGPLADGNGRDGLTPNCPHNIDYSVLYWLAVSKTSSTFIPEQ